MPPTFSSPSFIVDAQLPNAFSGLPSVEVAAMKDESVMVCLHYYQLALSLAPSIAHDAR